MQKLKTDPRIDTIAGSISKCDTIIDIGTDHGKLPAKLLLEGVCKNTILVDISENSLQKAIDLYKDLDIKGKFIVSDGFENVDDTFDYAIISGMGGDLIASILQKGYDKLNSSKLVLGPNTKEERLRMFLSNIGYYVDYEKLVISDGRIYTIISASTKKSEMINRDIFLGKIFNDYNTKDEIQKYLNKIKKLLKAEIDGKNLSKNTNNDEIASLNKKIKLVDKELKELNQS